MQYELLYRGAFPLVKASLDKGESLKCESGAMVAMSSALRVEGKMEGGFLGGLSRKFLTGESFFMQTIVAEAGAGEVYLAHSIPGDIIDIPLDGSVTYAVQKGGFLAGESSLQISTKTQNLTKGLFSGEGFFIVKVSGIGTLFVSSYGSIHSLDIPTGEDFIVDNQHLVAWPDTMQYGIEKASSGWISSITSGEGLVTRFKGPGRVLIQTRNPGGFGSWIQQFIPRTNS